MRRQRIVLEKEEVLVLKWLNLKQSICPKNFFYLPFHLSYKDKLGLAGLLKFQLKSQKIITNCYNLEKLQKKQKLKLSCALESN